MCTVVKLARSFRADHCLIYSVYKKTLWNLNYLQAVVVIWQFWMLRINDSQKHKVLYTWELYDVIFNFQCVQDLLFWRIIYSKHSELSS